MFVKLCFSLHFIPLDPDTRTQMNPDPTGSGSTSVLKLFFFFVACLQHGTYKVRKPRMTKLEQGVEVRAHYPSED